uniref:Exonuclease domain-containing protein n=1 Tax=Clastoptera arizonana TaxID=38151 RepID=A0A1B6DGM4_9HEMI
MSGLVKKVLESKVTEQQAEQLLLDFVKQHTAEKKCPLAGNSISFDRYFMLKYFPKFEHHLNYRMIDVSSIKELCKRWFPEEYSKVLDKKRDSKHRALDDIRNSIAELQYYRKTIFRHHEGAESMAISWC